MTVKEASYPSLERRCLLQITDGAGAVEELPFELRGNSIPAHKHGRAQVFQNLLFFLDKGSTVVVLSRLNRLVDIDSLPFFVFGKPRVGLLEIAELPHFVRRTRCVGEKRPEFGCFSSILFRSEHLICLYLRQARAQQVPPCRRREFDWSVLNEYGDDRAN